VTTEDELGRVNEVDHGGFTSAEQAVLQFTNAF